MVHSAKNATGGTMPIDDRMTVNERRNYLRLVRPCYRKVRWVERSALLTEMEAVTGRCT